MDFYYLEDEPDTFITVEPVYKIGDHEEKISKNPNFLFDFDVTYTATYESDSDSDRDEGLEHLDTETHHQKTLEFDKNRLIGGDKAQIEANVCEILDMIDIPRYQELVKDFTEAILDFKKLDVVSMEKVKVEIHIVTVLPLTRDENDGDVEVTLAVAPASDDAVENHLETVAVGDDEGLCVICMENIQAVSDMAAAQMTCKHVFHRICVEEWLRHSGICPVCRAVFPS